MARLLSVLLVVISLLLKECNPYSMGAPDQACKRMTPGHGFDPQDGDPPVVLEMASQDDILPGGHIDLRLVSTEGSNFKGFIIQVRDASEDDSPIGNFETEEASYMTCGKGIHNSITHRNSNPKTSIKARWKAPQDFEGEVYFRFSTVVEYDKYWVNVDGPKIRISRSSANLASEFGSEAAVPTTTIQGASETVENTSPVPTPAPTIDPTDKSSPILFPDDEKFSTVAIDEVPRDVLSTPQTISIRRTTTRAPTTTTTTTLRPVAAPEVSIQAIPKSNKIFEDCGKSKSCFGMPVGCLDTDSAVECKAVVSYELSGDQWLFKMIGKSDGYISVGLSTDDKMGDDLTTSCYYNQNNGEVGVQTGYNRERSNIALHPPKLGITNFNGRYEDGFIECDFKRPQTIEIAEDGGKTFNLQKDPFIILLAEGGFREGSILKHRSKDSSSEPQALGIVTNLSSKSKILLKLHGAFMIGSWIFAGSLGILLARYFKQTWTGSKCCKLDQWFVFHRILMVTTWLLTMAGFIIIFVELGLQWTKIPIEENPHAVLGCITTGLCFIQPFMALMRCHPGTPRRPIFNWLHWFVGNSAHILGIVAIFFAVDLEKAKLPKETDYLLIAFVAFHFLMHLTLSLMMCISDRQRKMRGKYNPNQHGGNNGYPMHQMGYASPRGINSHPYPDYEELKGDSPGSGVRKFFLAVYILVSGLVAAALIALVVLAPSRPLLQEVGILSD